MENCSVEATAAIRAATRWRRPEIIDVGERPAALWPWLVEEGSLTARLRAHCGDAFRVRVLASGESELTAGEADWTGCPRAYVREVHLCCGATPWVHARTIAVGAAAEARLRGLGESPLGDGAFEQPSTTRDSLEIARVAQPGAEWTRRSVLHVDGEPLYIAESFLDGGTPWQ
ncbi:MAG TPA: chorismate lyase [Gammaproteobacteria bacterium]|nr:chorismate lyase [Gammaproteobacteria bacterium]